MQKRLGGLKSTLKGTNEAVNSYHNEVQMLGFTGATTVTPSAHEPRQSSNPGDFHPKIGKSFDPVGLYGYRKLDVQLPSCMLQRMDVPWESPNQT